MHSSGAKFPPATMWRPQTPAQGAWSVRQSIDVEAPPHWSSQPSFLYSHSAAPFVARACSRAQLHRTVSADPFFSGLPFSSSSPSASLLINVANVLLMSDMSFLMSFNPSSTLATLSSRDPFPPESPPLVRPELHPWLSLYPFLSSPWAGADTGGSSARPALHSC